MTRKIPVQSLIPDEAIDNAEKFGFEDYSRVLTPTMSDPNLKTPFTIAIHGSWGTGKTSLMKTIKNLKWNCLKMNKRR